jgi:hypothetical protein
MEGNEGYGCCYSNDDEGKNGRKRVRGEEREMGENRGGLLYADAPALPCDNSFLPSCTVGALGTLRCISIAS